MGTSNHANRVCLIPNVAGIGGTVTFRDKLVDGLMKRGIGVTFELSDAPYAAILIIGGTRDLLGLWRAKRRGVPITQRLDGMNWIHRVRQTGWRHYLRAVYGNMILSLIRSKLADQIIYQSKFSQQWWERAYGVNDIPWRVIYNGVDLERYTPTGSEKIPDDHVRILLVEGSIGSGYEWGLETAVDLAERLYSKNIRDVEVMVAGRVAEVLQSEWSTKTKVRVNFMGQVPPGRIPELCRSAHMLYAADLNPACPNSVVEALACGLPVVAFATGALSELVTNVAGKLVPYGGDPWKMDKPDMEGLVEAAIVILNNQTDFRRAARKRAEEALGIDLMVDGYLGALNI